MLKGIKVENVALIEEENIEFFSGLNVLSGETGAGKSIIINALCFALGSRADKTLIRTGADYAKVTANFEVNLTDKIKIVLEELDVEPEENIIIVRKMFLDGKGDIKVNGVPVTQSMLKKLTACLIDVYGQFEHTAFLDAKKHLQVLDEYGGQEIAKVYEEYKEQYLLLNDLKRQLNELGGDEQERAKKIDYLQYQINEIKMINPQLNEDEELSNKKNIMLNAEKLAQAYSTAQMALDGEEYSGRLAISTAKNKISSITNIDNNAVNLYERLHSLEVELDDIVSEITNLCESCDFNEQEFNEVDQRLDSIKMLKRKYGNTIDDILSSLETAEKQLNDLLNCNEIIEKINNQIVEVKNNLTIKAQKLTKIRKIYAEKLQNEILKHLSELGMGKSQFKVSFEESDFTNNGIDNVEFMFSANLGEPLKPLNKIISGGELSRFMLAFKTCLNKTNNIETQIYDEIDAGISGHIGQVIAIKLYEISKQSQVITITHLPQIASMADNLFNIQKFEKDGKTYTQIERLDETKSLKEIARLSGGENIGENAIEFAKDMKNWAKKQKSGN